VIGIFPNEDAVVRPIGAVLLERHRERAVLRACYMTVDTIVPLGENPFVILPRLAA
jgi:hypothetical protein